MSSFEQRAGKVLRQRQALALSLLLSTVPQHLERSSNDLPLTTSYLAAHQVEGRARLTLDDQSSRLLLQVSRGAPTEACTALQALSKLPAETAELCAPVVIDRLREVTTQRERKLKFHKLVSAVEGAVARVAPLDLWKENFRDRVIAARELTSLQKACIEFLADCANAESYLSEAQRLSTSVTFQAMIRAAKARGTEPELPPTPRVPD